MDASEEHVKAQAKRFAAENLADAVEKYLARDFHSTDDRAELERVYNRFRRIR